MLLMWLSLLLVGWKSQRQLSLWLCCFEKWPLCHLLPPPSTSISYTVHTKFKGKASERPSTSAKGNLERNKHFNFWIKQKTGTCRAVFQPGHSYWHLVSLCSSTQPCFLLLCFLAVAQQAFEVEVLPERAQGWADASDHSLSCGKPLAHRAMPAKNPCGTKQRHSYWKRDAAPRNPVPQD